MNKTVRTSTCACGRVAFETIGEPIVTGVCYCDDCQGGARLIEALPDAPAVLEEDGGASYLTFRNDRVRFLRGEDLLVAHTLNDKSPTKRFSTRCCNSALYLKFRYGSWVSTYRNRYETKQNLPPVEMRTGVRFRNSELPFPDDAPRHNRFPASLFGKLIKARLAMLLDR